MANGYSLHIGVNEVDPIAYQGSYRKLRNPENDAKYYQELANSKGFQSTLSVAAAANSISLLKDLTAFAKKMRAGDILFLSFSGHGTKVPDLNGDEEDRFDEALVLYDRLLIDDELRICWSNFQSGTKIFFINDSCFNGTVSRFMLEYEQLQSSLSQKYILRGVDRSESEVDFEKNKSFYQSINLTNSVVACSVIHIGSCQDNQLSDDGTGNNGYFTSKVKEINSNNRFNGSYHSFFVSLLEQMPPWQTPNWDTNAGVQNSEFEKSPFLSI